MYDESLCHSANQAIKLFAIDLYKILRESKENILFSPISLHSVLSQIAQGAAGTTKQTFMKILYSAANETTAKEYKRIMEKMNNMKDVTCHLANKVYINESLQLKKSFESIVTDSFYSAIEALNFSESAASAQSINSWIENKTNQKIKNLVCPGDLDSTTQILLINAIYFKGNWSKPFDMTKTTNEKFYLNENDFVYVQMMHREGIYYFNQIDHLDAKVAVLPYSNRKVEMVIMYSNKKDGFSEMEEKLKAYDFSRITECCYSLDVKVSIPKFRLETSMELTKSLIEVSLNRSKLKIVLYRYVVICVVLVGKVGVNMQ